MICEEETFKKFGYYSNELSRGSKKKILASCDECGKVRETSKNAYRILCLQCAIRKYSHLLTENDRIKFKEQIGILEQETYDKFGYYPSTLKSQSGKKILAKCIDCGKIRITSKNAYCVLCRSCGHKGKHHSEETKQKMSDSHIGIEGENSSMFGKHHSKETKQRMHEARKGENNPRWLGGVSFEPYCLLFDENFKERVREFFNRTCYLCGRTEAEQMNEMLENKKRPFRLAVHHVGYNKETCCDDSIPLFVPLCIKCHSKTNKDRSFWEVHFTERIMKEYNGKCFYTKEETNEMKKDDSDD